MSDSSMSVRAMQTNDASQCAALDSVVNLTPWSENQFLESLDAGHVCVVSESNDVVSGFAVFSVVLEEAMLLCIAVNPDDQAKGLGTALLGNGLQRLKEQGALRCVLEVRESNKKAQAFYNKHSFSQIGLRKAYYPAIDGRENALVYERNDF